MNRSNTTPPKATAAVCPEIKRGGEQRYRGAARFRRHLRGVGLQRVVQHVEAEPDGHDGERRDPVTRLESERDVGHREKQPAAGRKPGLAEPVEQQAHAQTVGQAADGKGADEQADQRKADAETQVQIGADIGEGAEHGAELDEGDDNDGQRPRRAQHQRVVGDKAAARLRRRVARMRNRIAPQFVEQTERGDRQQSGEDEEHVAPAERSRRARRRRPGRTIARGSARTGSGRAPAGGARRG